jgi:hypothetical protein
MDRRNSFVPVCTYVEAPKASGVRSVQCSASMLQVAEAQEESVLWFHSIISVLLGRYLMCTQQGDVEGVPCSYVAFCL